MGWLWALIAVIGGFILAVIASRVTRNLLTKRSPRLAAVATAAASLVFSLIFVAGLLAALGVVQPASLARLRDDTIHYLPRLLSAVIVVIIGTVLGTIVSTTARESLQNSLGRLGAQIPSALRSITIVFSVILAARQLGIDTSVINIVVAAVCFGIAAAAALIIGFGAKPVATEIAVGRALRRMISPGDTIITDDTEGVVIAIHPTAVEILNDETATMIPNSQLNANQFQLIRAETQD